MHHRIELVRITFAAAALALLATTTDPAAAQGPEAEAGARMEVSTTSAEARTELTGALEDWANAHSPRALVRARRALELDPGLGLARAVAATLEPGLSRAERRAELERAVADEADAAPASLLYTIALREFATGTRADAVTLVRAARDLAPDDPFLAYVIAVNQTSGAERVATLRELAERFPDYGPIRNVLGYDLWRSGERAEGKRQIEEYVRLMPDHPNPHDSYAEFLQYEGEHAEAERHYRRALELDPGYFTAYDGLAEALALQGRTADAHAVLREARERAERPGQRAGVHYHVARVHLFDGDLTAAQQSFEQWGREAGEAGLDNPRRLAAWYAAMAAAHRGAPDDARRLMEQAAAVAGDAGPSQPFREALAAPDDAATLRAVERRLARAAGAGDAAPRTPNDLAFVRTLIALERGDLAAARNAAGAIEADPGLSQLARAHLARRLARDGQRDEARRLRQEILDDPIMTLYGSMARALAHAD